ncbi:MAG TPA: lipoyl synthase [Spirochaetia bacterium]|nr:MAG: lipoyl synthase [Spirochaetes bacterium GWB1_36_13]HCL55514.1 lipoyl synthase [Spirochaetia bacterium]
MNLKKPEWLKKKYKIEELREVKKLLKKSSLHTICEESRCPNICECFSKKQATFLIMGNICTRLCSFCNVTKGKPLSLDPDEPERVAEAVYKMKLRHVVITSPTRDDLENGGALHFKKTAEAVRKKNPLTTIELLIPDFQGNTESLKIVLESSPDILGHNIETVPSLYQIRKGSDYKRSLNIFQTAFPYSKKIKLKSGLMLGLGETEKEVIQVLKDLFENGCRFLSIGQYLAPSKAHYPVKEYINPEIFDFYKKEALKIGFEYVESSPFVRSSYHADEYLKS